MTSSFFISPSERTALCHLMEGRRFDSSLVLGAGDRCRFGKVRVLVCAPFAKGKGAARTPFPTTFWLACPWLVRRAGAVEAAGGVRRLEAWLSDQGLEREWRAYNRLHQQLRVGLMEPFVETGFLPSSRRSPCFSRLRRGGVGGMDYARRQGAGAGVRVKCLHLQTASWLALGYHPGGEWLRREGLDALCPWEGRCQKA